MAEELLVELEERVISHGSQKNLVIDVVILKKDCTAHCLWKPAKITELITGRGNRVQAAKVQLLPFVT